nr:unnamed protein product [Callosobruchus chinensis]
MMDDDQLGWTGSCMTVGAMLIAIPMSFLCERIGRKSAALVAGITLFLGWITVMFAYHELLIYVGRVLTGIGGGGFCVVGPLYTSEIAEPAIRGTLGSYFQFFVTIGMLYANVLGYLTPTIRLFNVSCAAVPLIFLTCFVFQPESPVYYMRKSKLDQAEKSLKKLRGKDYDCSDEMRVIQDDINHERRLASFKVAIKHKAARKAMFISIVLMVYEEFCGDNAVTFYTQEFFIDAGSSIEPHLAVILLGLVQLTVMCFATWAIEKAGRKALLMISCGTMTCASTSIGLFFTFKYRNVLDEDTISAISFMPIVGVNLFFIGFSFGLGPIPWMAASELCPPEVKSKCISAASTFHWLLAFTIARFYLNFAHGVGRDVAFYTFATVTFSGILFTHFVIPETKGKTFEQITEALQR